MHFLVTPCSYFSQTTIFSLLVDILVHLLCLSLFYFNYSIWSPVLYFSCYVNSIGTVLGMKKKSVLMLYLFLLNVHIIHIYLYCIYIKLYIILIYIYNLVTRAWAGHASLPSYDPALYMKRRPIIWVMSDTVVLPLWKRSIECHAMLTCIT